MMTKVKFGKCLNLLLSALDISNNRLSKGINVDSSLISRWLHEQRIPSYHSKHVESIALFCSQSILNSFQKQRLNEAINAICSDIDESLDTRDRLMKALLESQGLSLESKKIETGKENSSLMSIQSINLSKEDTIIIGRKNILSAILSLIEIASKVKCQNDNVIYISFSSNLNVAKYNEELIRWRDLVLKALTQGYTVKFLYKSNHTMNDTIDFINFAKPLIETGRFLPYYNKAYDMFDFGREVTIIPGIGALIYLSSNPNSEIDSAFYIKNQVGIDILSNNFNAFVLASSKSLVKYYTYDENLSYHDSLLENEERAGNRFLFKERLSLLIVPNILYTKLLEKQQLTNNQLIKELELHKLRQDFFLFNLQYYEHFDIYTLSSIQNIIKSKQLSFNFINGIITLVLEIEDIIILIQNLIYLIKTYDNYKFALVNETLYKSKNFTFSSFIMKEKHRVHIEFSKFRVAIEEPMIVHSLEKYFKEIWEHIAPVDKNIKEIVKWLQHQVDLLHKINKKI